MWYNEENAKENKMKTRLPGKPYLSAKERARLTHQFMTDYPNAKPGMRYPYENRDHFYIVEVYDVGDYGFYLKLPLNARNQAKIAKYRKERGNNGE